MKAPVRRSKRIDQEESELKVTTPVALRAREKKLKNCSKTRAVRVRPEYPLTRTTAENMKLMPPEFFQIDALDLAPRLLGKFLRKDNVVLRITEVRDTILFLFPEKKDLGFLMGLFDTPMLECW